MYKFNHSIPLKDLAGQEIIQVCFGVHDIIIRFERGQYISIFVKSVFYRDNGWNLFRGNEMMLNLVGTKVSDFSIEDSLTAKMISEDGAVINFVDSPSNLESFSFFLVTGEYVV